MRFVSAPDPCAVGVRSARSWRGAGQSRLRLSRSSCPATAHPVGASVRGGRGTTHRCPLESRQRGHEADRRSLLRRRDAGRAAANAVANANQPRRRVRRTNGAGPAGQMRTGSGLAQDWARTGRVTEWDRCRPVQTGSERRCFGLRAWVRGRRTSEWPARSDSRVATGAPRRSPSRRTTCAVRSSGS